MKRRLKIGRIYINAWNPELAGFYVGRKGKDARLIRPDMSELLLPPNCLVPSIWTAFDPQLLKLHCEAATEAMGPAAGLYAEKVLWNGEYEPPTFEAWQARRVDA